MSECAHEMEWAGGRHVFDLSPDWVQRVIAGDPMIATPHWIHSRGYGMGNPALQGQFGDTPAACLRRFQDGVYSTSDIERVITLGLIGGGMKFAEVWALIDEHVIGAPLAKNAELAYAVIATLFVGAKAEA